MPLTRPIPKAAMPVVKVLRRDVRRPKELPTKHNRPVSAMALRWWRGAWSATCPMGLHPKATDRTPVGPNHFGNLCSLEAIVVFYRWWDQIPEEDAAAAVDAIWPRKKPKRTGSKR